jgi:DNA gyrase subunit A
MEDLIKEEEVAITISHLGYIKRTPVSEFRTQGRGGKGARGSKTREEDFIEHLFVANTHHYLLFFTEMGRCYWLRTFEIPEAAKTASGRAIQNILAIGKEDKVKAYIIVPNLTDADFIHNHYIVFSTRQGIIKKTAVEAFSRPRTGGINAITINEGDQLLEARLTGGAHEVFLASKRGFAVRFPEKNVRPMGRSAAGVIGMTLADENDAVVGMVCVGPEDKDASILVVSEKGNGKRSEVEDYRLTNRGAKGVKTLQVTDKTGELVAIKMVGNADDLMITSKNGIVIRISVAELPVLGRATQGVRAIRLDEDDDIADVTVVFDVEEVSELPQE